MLVEDLFWGGKRRTCLLVLLHRSSRLKNRCARPGWLGISAWSRKPSPAAGRGSLTALTFPLARGCWMLRAALGIPRYHWRGEALSLLASTSLRTCFSRLESALLQRMSTLS